MKNWLSHLRGLAEIEENAGKKVAFETSADMIECLQREMKLMAEELEEVKEVPNNE